MRIEFWLDYLCPISYLTHKNLIEALKELNISNYELYYRSFKLSEEDKMNFEDMMLKQHHEKGIKFLEENFPDYKNLKYYNTELAHHLSHLAKRYGLAKECNIEIFDAYYVKNQDISDKKVLLAIAKKIGLDLETSEEILSTMCFRNQIANNKENAHNRGIKEIPHIRINVKNNYNSFYTKDEIISFLTNCINNKNTKSEYCGEYCEY